MTNKIKLIDPTIQLLTIFNGLAINFLVPIAYGIEAYGLFIQNIILVLVIHKFADTINEPLISFTAPKYIFFSSIICSSLVIFILIVFDLFEIKSLWLLVAMLLSSSCMLSMFALKLKHLLILHLVLALLVFLSLIIFDKFDLHKTTIENLFLYSNLLPSLISIFGILVLGAKIPPLKTIKFVTKTTIYKFPRNISTTLVLNCLTNFFPYILAKQLSAFDIGMYRVSTSLLQSATSIFPVNIRSIFIVLVEKDDKSQQLHILLSTSLVYFSAIGFMTILAAYYLPILKPYVYMLWLLPILYWTILIERYMHATGAFKLLVGSNILISGFLLLGLLFVKTLNEAVILYALGVSIYLVTLAWFSKLSRIAIIVTCVVVVLLFLLWCDLKNLIIDMSFMGLLILVSIIFMKFRFSDLKNLKF